MIHKLKTKIWSNKLRIRTGEVVQHKNGFYANKTGVNSEPEMNGDSNWLYIGEVEKNGSFILRSGENLTAQEIIHLKEILGIGNNFNIGFADDGTLDNGFDVPMEQVFTLAFSGLDFEYELDEENGTILIKSKNGGGTDVTLEQARQNGNVFKGDVQFGNYKITNDFEFLGNSLSGISGKKGQTNYLVTPVGFIRSFPNGKYSTFLIAASSESQFSFNTYNDDDSFNTAINPLTADAYYEHGSPFEYTQKKYVDRANSYSTTEIKTGGTWIDGKPIYRKVFTGGSGAVNIDITSLNIETEVYKYINLVDGDGFRNYQPNNNPYQMGFTDNKLIIFFDTFFLSKEDNSLFYQSFRRIIDLDNKSENIEEFFLHSSYAITLEYTKTTD